MNRQMRRATGLKIPLIEDYVIAVHEAGHAVGRILAADELGHLPETVITFIEMGPGPASRVPNCQATVYGPMHSKELNAVFQQCVKDVPTDQWTNKHYQEALTLAREEGIDVDRWLKGQLFWTVLGPAAEAMYTGKTLYDVWHGPQSANDFKDAVHQSIRAGLTHGEITAAIEASFNRAEADLNEPNIQLAIYALADALPVAGRMSGKKAHRIIMTALAGK